MGGQRSKWRTDLHFEREMYIYTALKTALSSEALKNVCDAIERFDRLHMSESF